MKRTGSWEPASHDALTARNACPSHISNVKILPMLRGSPVGPSRATRGESPLRLTSKPVVRSPRPAQISHFRNESLYEHCAVPDVRVQVEAKVEHFVDVSAVSLKSPTLSANRNLGYHEEELHLDDARENWTSLVQETLQTLLNETAELGQRNHIVTGRLGTLEKRLESLASHIEASVVDLEKQVSQEIIGADITANVQALRDELGSLGAQGESIFKAIANQSKRNSLIDENFKERFGNLESHVDTQLDIFQTELRRLREALDVENMVREDADARLQGMASDAELDHQSFKAYIAESFAAIGVPLVLQAGDQAKSITTQSPNVDLVSTTNTKQQQFNNAFDISKYESVDISNKLEAMTTSTASLLRRVAMLEVEQENAHNRIDSQSDEGRKLCETGVHIHREEMTISLQRESDAREQALTKLERQLRSEVEAAQLHKERHVTAERRITSLNASVSEIRQHLRLPEYNSTMLS